MQVRKTGAVGVDGKHRAITRNATTDSCPIENIAYQNQVATRRSAERETMQVRKTLAIGVDGEHRAASCTATILSRSIQGVARQNHSGLRRISVAIGSVWGRSETIQVCKTSAIRVNGEHRAYVFTTARGDCPV